MKYKAVATTIALAAFLVAVPTAFAVDDHHAGDKPADKAGAPAKPTSGKAAPSAMDMDKQMTQMQQNMLRMHEQMHKIMQAKDAKERDRLTQEHRQMLREHMQVTHGMSGDMGGMMDHGKMGSGTMGGGGK